MTALIWLAIIAVFAGLALILRGGGSRRRHGLNDATTLDLDRRTLYSARYGLSGRPDRLFRDGQAIIPEEWKSSRRVYDSHRAQLAVYLILVEEEYGVRPPYGVVVLGDGRREQMANTGQLRAWVLGIAQQIREARRNPDTPIPVRQPPAKCRGCGMRRNCKQARM